MARQRRALLLFLVAAFLGVFLAGMYVEAAKLFPARFLRSGYKTLVFHLDFLGLRDPPVLRPMRLAQAGRGPMGCAPFTVGARAELRQDYGLPMSLCPVARVARQDAAAARVESVAGGELADPVLVKGEANTFFDQCPAPSGCLAVQYSRSGSIQHAWPFRPDEIAKANIAVEPDFPYERPLGWSLARSIKVWHVAPYPGGDLLVVLHLRDSHPQGGGVARVAPDGRPRWYRQDYSHHFPHVVDDGRALVPGQRFWRRGMSHEIRVGDRTWPWSLECYGDLVWEDQVNILGAGGELLEEIPILDAILQSPFAASLLPVGHACDPIHLNFVHQVGADADGAVGVKPGDLVVSMRNLNAFGILDVDDRRLKKLVRGSFQRQHGVRHLREARFLLFDNLGSDGIHARSRLLMVDLATGEETTIFPTDQTPEHLRGLFAHSWGQFDVSADRQRALLTDVLLGRAFEIRLADGAVLNVFHQVHDLSPLPGFPSALAENAWLFEFHGIHYAKRWTP